jgi:hypothetical protein
MGHRASVNQQVQLGAEATPGTAVAANRLLTAFTWTFGAKPVTKQFVGTGRKRPSASELLTDASLGKVAGQGDFNQLVYLLSSVYGKAIPALHGMSSTAYDWKFVPPITGAAAPQTYTLQNGDATDAEQYPYTLFTGWGYTFGRKSEFAVTGDWFAQEMAEGVTLTASPTEVPLSPITGAMANISLDASSAGIGATLLQNPLNVAFAATNYYGEYWPIARANASYSGHVDLLPKDELKLKLEADSTAIAIKGNYLETGARCYVRVDAQGPVIDSGHSINAVFQHDLVCFVADISELSDTDGVYSVEYTFQVAEDTAWTAGAANGTAQVLTLTNLLAAL